MTFYDTVERVDLVFIHTCETWITLVLVVRRYGKNHAAPRYSSPQASSTEKGGRRPFLRIDK